MIFPVESQTKVRTAPALPLTTKLGAVHIAVTDRDRALAIWRDVVGLEPIFEAGNELSLGVGRNVLIVLETGAIRPVVQRTTGLYHVAIHVPKRSDLAQFAVRALQRNVRISPTDHLVSEAIYLWDADGNGIEITFETPWRGTLGDPDQRLDPQPGPHVAQVRRDHPRARAGQGGPEPAHGAVVVRPAVLREDQRLDRSGLGRARRGGACCGAHRAEA